MNLKGTATKAERAIASAAERNARWLKSEDVKSAITPRNILIVLLALGWIATCALAKKSGRDEARFSVEEIAAKLSHDTVRLFNDRVKVDTIRVTKYVESAATAQAQYDTARARVLKATANSAAELPVTLVLPAITLCDSVLVKAARLDTAQTVALSDALKRGDVLQNEVAAKDYLLTHQKRSKWQFVAGVVTGAVGIVLVRLALK